MADNRQDLDPGPLCAICSGRRAAPDHDELCGLTAALHLTLWRSTARLTVDVPPPTVTSERAAWDQFAAGHANQLPTVEWPEPF